MSEGLVVIAHELPPDKADSIRTSLEAAGIKCFLSGNTEIRTAGPLSSIKAVWGFPEGDVVIRVCASDTEAAKSIQREIEAADKALERKGSIVSWLSIGLGVFVQYAMQEWLLTVLVTIVAYAAMSFFAFKKTFNSKGT